MATEFKQYTAVNLGTIETIIATMAVKGLVVNVSIANKIAQENAITLYIKKDTDDIIYLAKNKKVAGNEPSEVVKSNKIVLEVGDSLCGICAVNTSCDVVASILEGVK